MREAVVKLAQAYCAACAEAQAARLRSNAVRLGNVTALRAGPLGAPSLLLPSASQHTALCCNSQRMGREAAPLHVGSPLPSLSCL